MAHAAQPQLPPAAPARPRDLWLLSLALILIVVLTHLPYLELPLFWDELGQFVPAALDLYREGRWIPHSAHPNVHPPALMAYLALVWKISGYSIITTRLAMLLVGGLTVLVTFLLAIRLCRGVPGAPAFSAITLLIVSPLFYTQSLLAQLDLPATLLTLWALLEFLEGRIRRAALVSTALVLTKETGVAVPLVFAVWLWREDRRRQAAWFLLPVAALIGWLAFLYARTGYWLGSVDFERYNLYYPLHPVRFPLALLRRLFYLFVDNFHFIGWIAILIAWRRTRVYADRAWRVTALLGLVHVVTVTVLGGAVLERYLLPVLPLLYIAMAAGWSVYSPRRRHWTEAVAVLGLLASLFWTRPLPAPLENNLAMVDFIRLQQEAAQYLQQASPARVVTTAWPLSEALRSPDFGYVRQPIPVREIPDFSPQTLLSLNRRKPETLVIYRRDWNPGPLYEWFPALARLRERYYGFAGEAWPEFVEQQLGLTQTARWSRRGQWLAVLQTPQ